MKAVAVVAVIIGGLALAAGIVGEWAITPTSIDLEIIELDETEAIPGSAYAPAGLPIGLAAVVIGAPLIGFGRGRLRIIVGVLLVLTGIAATALVGVGIVQADRDGEELGSAPFGSLAGALAVAAGGVLAVRSSDRQKARLSGRYELEGGAGVDDDEGADEWRMASADDGDDTGTDAVPGRADDL